MYILRAVSSVQQTPHAKNPRGISMMAPCVCRSPVVCSTLPIRCQAAAPRPVLPGVRGHLQVGYAAPGTHSHDYETTTSGRSIGSSFSDLGRRLGATALSVAMLVTMAAVDDAQLAHAYNVRLADVESAQMQEAVRAATNSEFSRAERVSVRWPQAGGGTPLPELFVCGYEAR